MNRKLIITAAAAVAILLPSAGALTIKADDVTAALPLDLGCEQGVTEVSYPEPTNPALTVTVSIVCPGGDLLDSNAGTDCPGDSWSYWGDGVHSAVAYTYDTTNPYGFSQTAVDAAWDGANTVWDSQVAASLYAGNTFGGSASAVGLADGVNQGGFKLFSGQVRTAIAAQWAWRASDNHIVETDSGYNTYYAWAIGAVSGKYDLQSVAAQEFGHGYGLGHSDTSTASKCLTMYPYGTGNSIAARTLGDGDINGIKAQYP